MKRRDLIKGIALAAPLVMSGCATEMLRTMDHPPSTYSEQIDAVLISQDLKSIVVIGGTYEYIFRDTATLSKIIRSKVHKHLSGEFSGFRIEARNHVRGNLFLTLGSSDDHITEEARALGFRQKATGELYIHIDMSGLRYKKNPGVTIGEAHKLNRRYSVNVAVPAGVNPGKLLLTPVALAADGALVLLGLPLIALFVVFGSDQL
ncbi:MAG: hypothetical protein ACREPV_09250 [Lysobacter sp.]